MFRPEVLAPAGNLFKLKTAVRYGADAVYCAGRRFGLRSAADNFTASELHQGCRFAHERGAKVYVVLNAFLFDEELAGLPPFLAELEETGVDAVIVSDLGVVETVRRHSRLAIHLSTQSSTLNVAAARFWRARGVSRIVLGREVAIEEAGRIKRDAGVEVELFIHGAMCMAYSGNCTISNYTAGRDSNRGGCIQSCRFRYTLARERGGTGPEGHFFSSKDLRGLELMDRFVAAQIDSLKIEGRMKSALYAATAASTYRAARDAAIGLAPRFAAELALAELDAMSHRDYTSGNLDQPAGADSVYGHADESGATHDMLGHVLEVSGEQMAIYLKNALKAGQEAQLLCEDGRVATLDTRALRGLDGKPLAMAHASRVVLLAAHADARPDLLLRKVKDAAVLRDAAAVG